MRILILSTIPAPYRTAIFNGLRTKYDTTIFFERTTDGERNAAWFEKQGAEKWFYILSNKHDKLFYQKTKRNIRSYDLVICYEPLTKEARRLQSLCIRKKIPYIVNADGAVGINNNCIKRIIKQYYFTKAVKCLAGCERAVEYFKHYRVKEERIVKHNFTSVYAKEILAAPVSDEEKTLLRVKLNIDEKVTFITIGQYIYRKGIDLLLEAWKDVNKDFQLLIIGGGGLREEYEKQISQHNMTNVHLFDYMPHNMIIDYLKASDCYVMPTREDIWGLVINEAMSVGLPIISSNKCTAANELVKDGENGFIYDVNNTKKLTNIINQTINKNTLKELSKKALEAIADHTYENIIASHIATIESLRGMLSKKNKCLTIDQEDLK